MKGSFRKAKAMVITMEHILISPGKLKLMLTKSDLDRYELDCTTMDSEDTLTRRAFRTLLADVKRLSGFDAADDKVFIQLYPSRDGGAEVYITRLSQKNEAPSSDSTVNVTGVYRFDSISAMLTACARVSSADSLQSSSAWLSDSGCYLITEESFTYREFLQSSKRDHLGKQLRGYGRTLTSPAATAYVREHCECIVDRDAVSTLARLA